MKKPGKKLGMRKKVRGGKNERYLDKGTDAGDGK